MVLRRSASNARCSPRERDWTQLWDRWGLVLQSRSKMATVLRQMPASSSVWSLTGAQSRPAVHPSIRIQRPTPDCIAAKQQMRFFRVADGVDLPAAARKRRVIRVAARA